jgi:hypothetical protein
VAPRVLAVLSLGSGTRALACSCAPTTEAEDLAQSDAAFEAVVLEVRHVELGKPARGSRDFAMPGERVKVRVTKRLKGPHGEGSIVRFETVTMCCICGVSVRKGEQWRMYVSGRQPYALHLCSGSRRLPESRAP